jgi:hypothetical protein
MKDENPQLIRATFKTLLKKLPSPLLLRNLSNLNNQDYTIFTSVTPTTHRIRLDLSKVQDKIKDAKRGNVLGENNGATATTSSLNPPRSHTFAGYQHLVLQSFHKGLAALGPEGVQNDLLVCLPGAPSGRNT